MKKRDFIYLLFAIILATVTCIITSKYSNEINGFFDGNNENSQNTDIVENDTASEVFTVQDYLDFRNDLREDKRKDSVFLTIPDVILVNILTNIGTNLTTHEIVDIYESYSDTYQKILSGAESQKYIDNTINDSIK